MPSAPLLPRRVADGFKGHHARLCRNVFHFFLPFLCVQGFQNEGTVRPEKKYDFPSWPTKSSVRHDTVLTLQVSMVASNGKKSRSYEKAIFQIAPWRSLITSFPQKITNLVRRWYDSAPPTEWSDERRNVWWLVHVVRPGIWLSILFKWELLRKEVHES